MASVITMESNNPEISSNPPTQSGLCKNVPETICWINWATIVTPGIFFSKADDLKSNNPDALVPTTVILPSKNSGSIAPSSTCHAGIIFILSVSVEYIQRLPSGLVGITKLPNLT